MFSFLRSRTPEIDVEELDRRIAEVRGVVVGRLPLHRCAPPKLGRVAARMDPVPRSSFSETGDRHGFVSINFVRVRVTIVGPHTRG